MELKELRDKVNRYLITKTDFLSVKDTMNEDQLNLFVDNAITSVDAEQGLEITGEQRRLLIRELVSAVISMGPLRPLMEDASITEIMVNGVNKVYVQREGKIVQTDVKFNNQQQLMHTIQKILVSSGTNKRVDESSPYVDLSLPDGSRANIILPPCSMVGPVLTIRKFRDDISTVEDLLRLGELDNNIATFMLMAMKAKLNVVFCGSTGSGKTTALNVFSQHIPGWERIVTIEDTPELRLKQEHVVSLVAKPANIEGRGEITMRDLFINSLRMRPDRVIVGEVRGAEMFDMIEAITSGHSGSLAIIHAESTDDCFSRMVHMMLLTGIPIGMEEIHKQVSTAIDVIVHFELFADGVRRVTAVVDLAFDKEKKEVVARNIFEFKEKEPKTSERVEGEWVMNKEKPSFYDRLAKRRVAIPEGFFNS